MKYSPDNLIDTWHRPPKGCDFTAMHAGVHKLGMEVATPDEARAMLGIPPLSASGR